MDERHTTPRHQTVTERKKLAQEVRHDLDAYRRWASAVGDSTSQKALYRAHRGVLRLLELEGRPDELFGKGNR